MRADTDVSVRAADIARTPTSPSYTEGALPLMVARVRPAYAGVSLVTIKPSSGSSAMAVSWGVRSGAMATIAPASATRTPPTPAA